jgi:hypothetical protein
VLVFILTMESEKACVLGLARNAELVHPHLPLVESFLNDAADGEKAAKYLLQAYAVDGASIDFTRFVNDWKDLVRLCRFHAQQTTAAKAVD